MKKSGRFLRGDLIACMFDRDSNSNEQLENAESAAERQIKLAFSNPCFEYWFLCHFGYFPRPYETYNEVVHKLKQHMKNYNKDDPDLYLKTKDKLAVAVKNAKKIKEFHENEGRELLKRETNPLTLVFELIELIGEFK